MVRGATTTFAKLFPLITQEDMPVGPVPIAIYTTETNVAGFNLEVATGNAQVLTANGISVEGGGTNWTLRLVPVENSSGTSTLSLTLSDGTRGLATSRMAFTVLAVNDPPILGPIADLSATLGEVIPLIALPIRDPDQVGTPAYSYRFSSSNPGLVDPAGMRVEVGVTNYLSLRATVGRVGSTTLQVAVSPSTNAGAPTSVQSFVFTQRPALFAGGSGSLSSVGSGPSVTADFGGTSRFMTWTPRLGMSEPTYYDNGTDTVAAVDRDAQAAVADFNGDGRPDLVLVGLARRVVQVWINDCTATSNRFRLQSSITNLTLTTSFAVADFDRDGDPDLMIVDTNIGLLRFYENRGEGREFRRHEIRVSSVLAQISAGDFDGDGWPDLLAWRSGAVLSDRAGGAQVLRNTGRGGFEPWSMPFRIGDAPAVANAVGGQAGSADFDGDGRLDVWLTYTILSRPMLGVYLNRGDGQFELIQQRSIGPDNSNANTAVRAAVVAGDFDGDGWADLLCHDQTVQGQPGGNAKLRIQTSFLKNRGGGVFGEGSYGLPDPVGQGWLSVADLNGDGSLDALMSRTVGTTLAFTNRAAGVNMLPHAPTRLRGVFDGQQLWLDWQASRDGNQTGALTYEVRIGTAPGRGDIMSAMADPDTGRRLAWQPGNAGFNTSVILTPSKERLAGVERVYWSVQAVDASLAGSGFASEETVYLSPDLALVEPPVILPLANLAMGTNSAVEASIYFGDNRTPARLVQIQVRLDRPDLLDVVAGTRTADGVPSLVVTLSRKTSDAGVVLVTVSAIDSDGNVATRDFQVTLATQSTGPTGQNIGLLRYEVTADRRVLLVPASTGTESFYESSEDLVQWTPVAADAFPGPDGLIVNPAGVRRFFRQRVP